MKASQGALVAMRPDGAVMALVGGTDYRATQFNRATQALRQPGSAFKAFCFPRRLREWLHAEPDLRRRADPHRQLVARYYQDKFYGKVSLREAFARSLNSVAVQLSEKVGRKRVVEAALCLGITEQLDSTPAVALGVSETTLIEMTGAYATFANLGNGVWPRGIERITARDGSVLYERLGAGPGEVASGQAVRKMLDVMQATVDWGTAKKAKLDRPVYGKTGTSQSFRDAWFVGLSRDLVTGVWVGNDDNTPMDKVTGGSLPVAIWHDFMAAALAGTLPEDVRRPQTIDTIAIATPGGPRQAEDAGRGRFLAGEFARRGQCGQWRTTAGQDRPAPHPGQQQVAH